MSKTTEDLAGYLRETAEELNDLMSLDMMEMYRHLADLGRSIPELPHEERIPANFVQGCTSNVHVSASFVDGVVHFRGSSEALTVRGYLAILCIGLSGLTPQSVLADSQPLIEEFAEKTNIRAALTPSRANAFGNIYRLMRKKAEAFVA